MRIVLQEKKEIDANSKLSQMSSGTLITPKTLYSQDVENNVENASIMVHKISNQANLDHTEDNAGDNTRKEDHYLTGASLVFCFVSLLLCLFLIAIDQTIIVTILDDVSNHFKSFNNLGWLTSGFLLSLAVCMAPWAKLSIIFGRKIALLVAIIIFEAGSLVCALANSMNMLIGGRALAGVGAGGIQVLVFIVIAEILPLSKRAIGMAMVGVIYAIACACAPLIGGIFTSKVTWRWCFYINLPIGGLAFVTLIFAFRPPKVTFNLRERLKLIDYVGNFLLMAGLILFLLALTFGSDGEYEWNSAAVICCFVIGSLLIVSFAIWTFKLSKNPLYPTKVLTSLPVSASAVSAFGMYASFIASVMYLMIYFQVVRDGQSWDASVNVLPFILSIVVASLIVGTLCQGTKLVKPYSVLGAILGPIGCGLLSLLDMESSSSKRIGYQILSGASAGMLLQTTIISSQIAAPNIPSGTISSTSYVTFARAVGGAIAGELSGVVYNSRLKSSLEKALKEETSSTIVDEIKNVPISLLLSSSSVISEFSSEAQVFLKHHVTAALRSVFYMCISFSGLALIGTLFITNRKIPK